MKKRYSELTTQSKNNKSHKKSMRTGRQGKTSTRNSFEGSKADTKSESRIENKGKNRPTNNLTTSNTLERQKFKKRSEPDSKKSNKSLGKPLDNKNRNVKEYKTNPFPKPSAVQEKREAKKSFEIKTPENPLDPMNLEDLSQELQNACKNAGWTKLMPVQSHALPYIMAKQDMMIQSRTGSGKTGAYLIPTFTQIDTTLRQTQALIIVPTRELALQVEQEARNLFCSNTDNSVRIVSVYGGIGYTKQLEALQKGSHIVIGTPGRILDHLLRRTLVLDNLRILIFDEADRMLSIGFYPDMKEIQRYLPKKDLLVNLFSATYPPRVLQLASEFLHNPQMLSLSQGQVHVATSQHYYCECSSMEKDRSLVRILEKENPASAIIFCNTKANVHYVTSVLQGFGYNADELSADLSQGRREQVLRRLRHGDIRFLVATDVAARGIDIPELSHVFLYEPPEDRESYIHRAGRTGRAGAAGTVISLVDIMQKLEIERIAKFYKIDILPIKAPSNEEIAAISSDRMMTLLETRRRKVTGLELERAKRFLPLVKNMIQNTEESEQLMLLALILDSDYQRSLAINEKKALIPQEVVEKPIQKNTRRGQSSFRKRSSRRH